MSAVAKPTTLPHVHDVYFALLGLRGPSLDHVLAHYVDWLLGQGEFARLRDRRLDLGVDESWTADLVLAGGTFEGLDDCRIEVARRDAGATVRFTHPDEQNAEVEWQTVASLDAPPGIVLVRHGARRVATGDVALEPLAPGAPAVLASLLDRRGVEVEPPELRAAAPVAIAAEAAAPFVRRTLLSRDRAAPIVVADGALLDPIRLARALRGMAVVVVPSDARAADAIDAALLAEGAPRELGFGSAAARLYDAALGPNSDPARHPAYDAARFLRLPQRRRSVVAAAAIASDIASRTMPTAFFD